MLGQACRALMLKRAIQKILADAGFVAFHRRRHHVQDGLATLHSDRFREDPRFQAAYARGIAASGGIDPKFEWRIHVALWAAVTALHVEGDFVECGVNAGFVSSAIMQYLNWNSTGRKFFLVDTFAGPVLSQYSSAEIAAGRAEIAKKYLAAGAYVTDVGRVRANFAEWPNAVVVQGAVPDVLATLPVGRLAFLHLDLNCAAPEAAALDFFWDSLSPGGIVLLDDYAYLGHQHQAEAIDAVLAGKGASVLSLPTGQGLIVK